MSLNNTLQCGIVGAVGRGGSFRDALAAVGATIHAVCDTNSERLDACAGVLGAKEKYTDYAEMLEHSELDAIIIGTPMPLHVSQSIMALERNLHVLCEVPAAVSIEECKQLVLACEQSSAVYMMAENYTYLKQNVLIRELARQGLFGDVYYAEGEYLHELKELNEITTWRRHWQTGIEGVTYGTHSLGPILQWMPGDRVARVCCEGSGHHYTDPRGEAYHQESQVMLAKTEKGALIKIRVDMLSDRPHAMTNYQLQGTDGVYESHRGGPLDMHKIWLRKLSQQTRWFDLDALLTIDPTGCQLPARGVAQSPARGITRRAWRWRLLRSGGFPDRCHRCGPLPHRHSRIHGYDPPWPYFTAIHPARWRLAGRAKLARLAPRCPGTRQPTAHALGN